MRFSGLCGTVFLGLSEAARLVSMSVRAECIVVGGAVARDSARFVQHSGLPLSFLPEVVFLFGIWIVSPFLVVQ
jgi:hypothetical protein